MKRRKWIRILSALTALVLMAALLPAAAEEPPVDLGMYDPYGSGGITVTWKEMNVAKNTKLPVYSAPYEDAWRGAKGKAAVSTAEKFRLLGTVNDGKWGLVDYEVDSRSRRVGWIEMPEGAARASEYGDMVLSRILLRITRSVTLTDDPKSASRKIRTLKAGEQVIGMLTYQEKGLIYVETQNEGKTAWGFIPANAAEDISETLITIEGNTCRIHEGVTHIGEMYDYIYSEETDDFERTVFHVEPQDIQIRMVDLYSLNENGVKTIELPKSLRSIGMEGISMGNLDELRLGGGIQDTVNGFYGTRIGRIVLDRNYTGGIPDGDYLTVGEWKVEEGNPLYSDIDGVLFSADGRKLLRYPNGRTDEHYDVPAGTLEIGPRAFSDDGMNIRLKSISLPIGLKKIGEYAFSKCGYLLSMTVPLTVQELAPNAFSNCVSLERLSLPNGLTARLDEDWVQREDFSDAFHGDNWATYPKPKEKEEWELELGESFRAYEVQLDNEEGRGTVTVYQAAEGSAEKEPEKVGGPREYVFEIRNGRANLGEDRWVDLKNLRNAAGDIFFSITDVQIADPAGRISPEGKKLMFSNFWDGKAIFYSVEGENNYYEVSLPLKETVLFRGKTGDGGKYGMIVPEGDSADLLGPNGEKINHLYAETQAKVLDEAEERICVETAYGTGWIDRNDLMIAEEQP